MALVAAVSLPNTIADAKEKWHDVLASSNIRFYFGVMTHSIYIFHKRITVVFKPLHME